MTILAFYQALQMARSVADVEEALSEFETKYRREIKWLPGSKRISRSYQHSQQSMQERLASASGIVHELEESQIERQALLRYASMRP